MKLLICQKYTLQKLTHFSQGSNVVGDAALTYMLVFGGEDIFVS
jgi:hypothetical protein